MKGTWRNRIVRYSEESPDQLLANPQNYRTHPGSQASALRDIMKEVGIVQNVIANERTGHIVDGHLRVMEALKAGQPTIPVTWVDLSPEEEAMILATFDPISTLAGLDAEILDGLLENVQTESEAINNLIDILVEDAEMFAEELEDRKAAKEKAEQSGGDEEEDEEGDGEEEEDQLDLEVAPITFPSDNKYGIPTLVKSKQQEGVPMPVIRWGRIARTATHTGTYHFYTDDYKFNNVFNTPIRLVESQCRAIVEPNVSTARGAPLAAVLWGIYRKRYLARWAQQYGITIFVDLNVEPEFQEYNLMGVPRGWKHYATRAYEEWPHLLDADYQTAIQHAGTNDIVFMVIAGGKLTKQKCQEHGWVHIEQEQQELKRAKE